MLAISKDAVSVGVERGPIAIIGALNVFSNVVNRLEVVIDSTFCTPNPGLTDDY